MIEKRTSARIVSEPIFWTIIAVPLFVYFHGVWDAINAFSLGAIWMAAAYQWVYERES